MKSIVHNLGLGDHIICAPIVARIASETSEKVVLPCWVHNLQSVQSFYVNIPNVHIVAIEKESDLKQFGPGLRLGCYSEIPRNEGEDFISWFYRQAEIGIEERDQSLLLWDAFQSFKENRFILSSNEEYAFVHDDASRGYLIDPSLINEKCHIRPAINGTILIWSRVLYDAREIHCIDSAFLHLADALPTTGKLFFHRYARSGNHNKNLALRKKWEILE